MHADGCGALIGLGCSCQPLLATLSTPSVTIARDDLGHLLAVATVYVESFKDDELLTLPEKLNLQIIEDILARYGRRY